MTRATATMITCLRNEGPFLIEWLAYHRAIGFDRFIIGANDCTDGSHEMLVRLAELGEVIYLPFSRDADGKGPQYQFIDLLHEADIIAPDDWVAWLDLDEFLVVHRGDHTVQTLIRDLGNADGIMINWRYFGVPPAVKWPGRQIHPDLCRCAPLNFQMDGRLDHTTCKTLYRHRQGLKFYIHGPIFSPENLKTSPDWRGGDGKPLRRKAWPRKRKKFIAGKKYVKSGQARHGWAQINHYATRHPDFGAMRRARGLGTVYVPDDLNDPSYDDFAKRYSDDYFDTYNLYSHQDTSILRHLPATDAQMARLLADDTLAHWNRHALALIPASS